MNSAIKLTRTQQAVILKMVQSQAEIRDKYTGTHLVASGEYVSTISVSTLTSLEKRGAVWLDRREGETCIYVLSDAMKLQLAGQRHPEATR